MDENKESGDVAQLIIYLPGMHEVLCTQFSALGIWSRRIRGWRLVLSYIANLMPAWDILDPVKKKERKKKNGIWGKGLE